MKKFIIVFIILLSLLIFPKSSFAYQQTEAVCYSQCAAYKFVWRGDVCYDLFAKNCSGDEGSTVSKTIKFLKGVYDTLEGGDNVDAVFKAWFVCKPLIEDCIVPQLNDCRNTCKNISQTFYAPNLSVGNPYGSISYQNVYYDEDNHQLVFKVTNNGGYASDIDVTASWGHTRNRDKLVSGGGTLFTEKIPELLFFGARIGSPKSPGDYITDFLIDQSNFSGFLKKYKSDANNHYVPPAWYKTVPFTAPDGEYTKVILNVDPNQMIPESSEGDNTYILEIDKLPTPVSLSVESLTFKRTNPNNLTEYMVSFDLKNSGQENGNAHVKWYEGNYESGKNPIFDQTMVIQGLNKVSFDHLLNVDVSDGGDSCNYSQKYTLVVFDDDGYIKTQQEFSLPKFAGSISGNIEDLFGKKVTGATVSTGTGQTATVNDSGYYHIKGIPVLGKVTVTATHPDFSKTGTKEVEITFDDSKDKCFIDGLTHNGIDFILKDQDVVFTATLKDATGKLVNGHILATNKITDNKDINNNFKLDKDINGTGELGALQPGQYMFTVSAAGYKTIAQTVSAVPNDQNLEFTLEPLLGRSNDGSLVIQAPQLLWQMDRGTEILSRVAAGKDGKRIILYTSQNKANTGKLYFLDPLTGSQIKVIPGTLATGGQSQACLETSYDGSTTAFLVHNGTFGMAQDTKNGLILFNSQGNEFARTEYPSGGGASQCSVSPDGFYIYPGFLINKGLYEYSRLEIEGIGGYSHMGYSSLGPLYFLHGNGLIAGCKGGGDQCAMTVGKQEMTRYSSVKGNIRVVDSSFNDANVIFGGFDKLLYYRNGAKVFEKDINARSQEPSASISMGGQYIIYSHNDPSVHNADFKIVTTNNIDKTPTYNKDTNENVLFVSANDKGLFYLAEKGKTLKYYQVGKYTVDYNPQSQPTPTVPATTIGLSYYQDGSFHSAGETGWADLIWGKIYLADQNVKLDLNGNLGSLTILAGTLFSLDDGDSPILLKGQMTADFNSPATIYAIKFNRYDLNLFQTKLSQFRSGTLPTSEYFVIKNIHTKFTVKNNPDDFNVSVDNGQVNVVSDKTEKTVNSGRQISIDASNKIKESAYLGSKIYIIVFGVVILVSGGVIFILLKKKQKK
jgi:hypothetical protein